MYLLEQFHLVQFFLFGAETLGFSPATGIVAPNGSGKSAVLDAMQIVLYGGDQNQIDLNAQSGGASGTRGRSVREYCLGYYRGEEHVREHATTYLTMVFRDTDGDLPPVSVGLALGASTDEPKLHVYGRYVVEGVALTLDDHLEANAEGGILPLTWDSFRKLMEEAARRNDGRLTLSPTAEKQIEAMLFTLRPKGRGSIDPKGFRRALKNALNLQKVPDTSSFVRNHIVDAHPIDLKEFRSQLDNLRALQEKVQQTLERLAKVDGLIAAGQKAKQARMHAAAYRALGDDYARELHMESVDASQDRLNDARKRLDAAQKRIVSVKEEHDSKHSTYIDLERQSSSDPALTAARDMVAERENLLGPIKTNLARSLREVVAAFDAAHRLDPGIGRWGHLAVPWHHLLDAVAQTAVGDELTIDREQIMMSLRESSSQARPLIEAARTKKHQDEQQLATLGSQLRIVNEQLKRTQEGKAALPAAIQAVRDILADQGFSSTPVCDLVTVADADWAPAIEGFLGRSRTALVVQSGRFPDALAAFNRIPWGAKPDSVLLVNPVKARVDLGTVPPKGLARLIHGENQVAVDYIRLRLGRLQQLERLTPDSPEGFTREGEQSGRADFGRRRPLAPDELMLGRQDTRLRAQMLQQERNALSEQAAQADRQAGHSRSLVATLEKLVGLDARAEDIQRWLGDHASTQMELATKAAMQQMASAPDLLARQQLIQGAKEAVRAAQAELEAANKAVGTHEEAVRQAQGVLDDLGSKTQDICAKAVASYQHPHMDGQWFESKRDELDASGRSLQDIAKHVREAADDRGRRAAAQIQALSSDLATYANQYDPQLELHLGDLDALHKTAEQEKIRLEESELQHYQGLSKEAAESAERTFKVRIAASLRDSFSSMRGTLLELNRTMERLPPFSNNEKYHFRWEVGQMHRSLYEFILKAADAGPEGDIFSEKVDTPEEFRLMLEGKDSETAKLLEDYRNFFNFEIEVLSNGVAVTNFSKRMDKGSGGEHRAPLFIVAAASMARALGKLQGDTSGMSLIIFDELGDKIDSVNTRAVFEYLKALGLQPVVAAPDDALGKINESVDTYIEMYRDEELLSLKHVRIDEEGHVILDSDNWRKHPEIYEQELRRVEASRAGKEGTVPA